MCVFSIASLILLVIIHPQYSVSLTLRVSLKRSLWDAKWLKKRGTFSQWLWVLAFSFQGLSFAGSHYDNTSVWKNFSISDGPQNNSKFYYHCPENSKYEYFFTSLGLFLDKEKNVLWSAVMLRINTQWVMRSGGSQTSPDFGTQVDLEPIWLQTTLGLDSSRCGHSVWIQELFFLSFRATLVAYGEVPKLGPPEPPPVNKSDVL